MIQQALSEITSCGNMLAKRNCPWKFSVSEAGTKSKDVFKQTKMRNSVKVLCLQSEAGVHTIPYKECTLTENVRSMLFPIHNESLNIEVLSTPHSIYSKSYYNKVDLYAYSQDGNIFFNLTPLAVETDVVAISDLFFRRLKGFISTYFEHEICKLDAMCVREDKKYFYLASFYFKHSFYDKALFFADRALKSGRLEDAEQASMLENKMHIGLIQNRGVDKSKVVDVIDLYGSKTENALCFVAEIERHIDTASLVFLIKLIDPRSLRYLERIYFFYKCAHVFSSRGKRRLAVANYLNAYFSIQDGYNIDTKARLYERSLDCAEKNWRPVIASVVERVARNEEEELKMLMRKDGFMNFCPRVEYVSAEHSEYFTLRVESFDNVVCFGDRGALYAESSMFADSAVYYLEFVRAEVVSKTRDLELLQVCGRLLGASPSVQTNEKVDIDVFKVVKQGQCVINMHCEHSVVLEQVKFRVEDRYFVSAIRSVRLVRIRPAFTYRISEMECMQHELRIKFEATTDENRRPKIFCPENVVQIVFDSNNKVFCVIAVEKHLGGRPIHILCELRSGIYKKYIFRWSGVRYTVH